jgi:GNAT superfamily N-acetyltransferase
MEIIEVTDPDALSAVHAELVVPNFPPAERGGVSEFVAAVMSGRSEVLVASREEQLAGVAVSDCFPGAEDTVLLAWLAISPRARSGGLGGSLLQEAVARWSSRGHVVAEIEFPDSTSAHPDHGAMVIDLPYVQPSMGPGLPRIPMLLLLLPPQSGRAPSSLPTEPLRRFMNAYFGGDVAQHDEDEDLRRIDEALAGDAVSLIPLNAES